ncbi:hypothetical protein BpHYR1_016335 [Brachionus plicatilis]|uniref:Centriolar satellite-associated tubulin polyglutamylase complex regulator 1 n=1 Tax=Brachionus plicatilis TaxID=10195 RepID=A0A3M7QYI8_BRAPC|nr:hypothetical protein BpHYR1_016335 [Brachionus plicatilis]
MSFDSSELIESLSCENNYITRNHIMEYLNDSVEQLLELKNIDPKIDVLEFFTEYFKTVLEGNHILYRDFSFVSRTQYNRACFVQKFFELFCHLLTRDERVNSLEMHSLVMLICVNFPKNLVDKSFRILSRDDNQKICFKDFIYVFQFQFFYKEFIEEAKEIYENSANSDGDSIRDVKKISDKISILIEKSKFECPPVNLIIEILNEKSSKLDFFELLHELALNEKIIKHKGKLPCPNEMLDFEKNMPNNDKSTKEVKEQILGDRLNLSNFKPNGLRQKSLTNISNCMSKQSPVDQKKKRYSSDSSSDTDT